jgi:long-chain acyl-CoA synthetase
MNVAHLVERTARRAGGLPAVALGRRVLHDYATLAARAARLAGALSGKLGLAPGERVAILAENRPEYVEALVAAWWAGLAAVPVNARLHPAELAYVIENAGAALCLASPALAGTVAAGPARVVELGSRDYARLLEAEPARVREVPADAMAWLFYTSGTTGRPKGAMITHGNLRAMTYAYFMDVDRVAPGDAILHAAPMSHGSGLYLLPQAAGGAVQVVPESGGFDEAELFATLAAWPGSAMFAAPTMVKRLVRHAAEHRPDAANLKTIVYGGAPMYLADLDAAHAAFGHRLAQIYGQGESPMCITALDKAAHADTAHPRWRERLASVGTAQAVCEVRVADGEGRALPAGEAGEVLVRGASVVPGYWRDPEATARTTGDGRLRTGDVGVLDADGFLTLKDRSKDLVISGGANVYPREVEEALLLHPGVREVAVVGVPDEEWGERVVACVVAAGPVTEAELDAHCLARIARYKRPRGYVLVEALPKNAYGKVLKRELRERLAGTGPGGRAES